MSSTARLILVATVTMAAAIVFSMTLARALIYAPDEKGSNATTTPPLQSAVAPDRLVIPKISVDAHVQHVGLAKSGNMAVPTNYTDVGWYRYGTYPGMRGSAVIDGHVNNGFGLDAVFKDLGTLTAGDVLYVDSKEGVRTAFVVEEVKEYPATEVPVEILFNRGDKARLNLITCAGTWDAATRNYDRRVVVYAVLQ